MAKRKIPDDFLSNADKDYLAELVHDYLNEKGIEVDAFAFQIEVEYPEEAVDGGS